MFLYIYIIFIYDIKRVHTMIDPHLLSLTSPSIAALAAAMACESGRAAEPLSKSMERALTCHGNSIPSIYVYVCMYVYVCIYIYIFIQNIYQKKKGLCVYNMKYKPINCSNVPNMVDD